jgi:uncharacterized transporter YbjL
MMGAASGALSQLGLPDDALRQLQANIAAGYAVTYVLGYILTLLFVPLAAPWLMRIDLMEEALKLEAALSGGAAPKRKTSPIENSRCAPIGFQPPPAGPSRRSKTRSAAAP